MDNFYLCAKPIFKIHRYHHEHQSNTSALDPIVEKRNSICAFLRKIKDHGAPGKMRVLTFKHAKTSRDFQHLVKIVHQEFYRLGNC